MIVPIIAFLLLIGSMLQAIMPGLLWLGFSKWPILPAIVIYYALTRNLVTVAITAFLAGLLLDALGELPLGYSSLALTIVGTTLNRYQDILYAYHPITHIWIGAMTNGVITTLTACMLLSESNFIWDWQLIGFKLAGTMLLGAALTPLIFRAIHSLELHVGSHPREEAA